MGFQAYTAALYGGADGSDRLILANDVFFQPILQACQTLQLILPNT